MNDPQYAPVQAKPARFGGLAVASLVLGIVGLCLSIIPVVNIVAIIAAVVGVILGAVAIAGTRKVMAIISVGLCVVACIVAVVVNAALVKAVDEQVGTGTVGSGSSVVTTVAQPVAPTTPTFGQTYTWPSGLAVQVGTPTACTPGQSAHPQTVQRGVVFPIKIINNSKEQFETTLLSMGMQAQYAGANAERIVDFTGSCRMNIIDNATVLPGKEYSYNVALAVGAAPAEMQLSFKPGVMIDKVVFVGQA